MGTATVSCDPLPKHVWDEGVTYYMDFDRVLEPDQLLDSGQTPRIEVTRGTVTAENPRVIEADVIVDEVQLRAYRAVSYKLGGGAVNERSDVMLGPKDTNGATHGGTQPIDVDG